MNEIRVLAVDDEEPFRRLLQKELSRKGFVVDTAPDGGSALGLMAEREFDVVLLDIMMPGMDGMSMMKKLRSSPSRPAVIVLTGNASIETAVEAMKHGAYDYLTKPYKLDEIEIVINRAHEFGSMTRRSEMLEQELRRKDGSGDFIGVTTAIMQVKDMIARIAGTGSNVLILGESGTGKELVANSIWRASSRSHVPFTALNCASLSENLIESELFGHEKGAFTNAYRTKYGIVEASDGGMLFMDEIGELPLQLQAKLLRFLDSGEFRRLGGNRTRKVSVRLIAATNRDLDELVRQGRFREDLFYRLNVISITVPPLRERAEDIPLLAEYFVRKFSHKADRPGCVLGGDAIDLLMAYHWPGNVRELANVIERAVILCDGHALGAGDLSIPKSRPAGSDTPSESGEMPGLEEMERRYIERVLRETEGNQSRASRILGINRKTLYLKLKKYGLG